MSATIEVPKGLDKLTPEETRLFDQMRSDDGGTPEPTPTPAAPPQPKPAPAIDPAAAAAQAPAPTTELDDLDDDLSDGQGDGQGGENRSKTVPHQQFHSERERRKAAEAKLQLIEKEAAAKQARLEERVNLITAAAQAAAAPTPVAPAPEEPIPDVATDPVGHFKAVAERTQKQLEAVSGIVHGMQSQQQRNAEISALQNWAAGQERGFEVNEPSYRAAMDHLTQSRRAELSAIGVVDPNEQARIIGTDIHNIALRSRQEGSNFAERLFKLAQSRGFQKAAPAAAAAPGAGQGAPAIPPLDALPTIPDPAAARMQSGRDNATTIGSAGTAPPTRLSVTKIADMSEGQFDALLKRMGNDPQALRDLMGH